MSKKTRAERNEKRRMRGAYYTCENMARELARKTLAPLVAGRSSDQILELRICDPAAGGGALLVASGLYLAQALHAAWEAEGVDRSDALSLVCSNCLYGVDIDAGAVRDARAELRNLCAEEDALRGHIVVGDSALGLTRSATRAHVPDRLEHHRRIIHSAMTSAILDPSMSAKDRRRVIAKVRRLVKEWSAAPGGSPPERITALARDLEGCRCFHDWTAWPVFDAVIMNPPFLGKSSLAKLQGNQYIRALQWLYQGGHGNADLCAYFVRLADLITKSRATIGMIATNTISQGSTRETGLQCMLASGWVIYEASTNVTWPGDAAVTVSVVHMSRGFSDADSEW